MYKFGMGGYLFLPCSTLLNALYLSANVYLMLPLISFTALSRMVL